MLPFQQTTDLVEKLRAQNVAFEELIFPDEIHDLLRWSDWVRAYRATAEFFRLLKAESFDLTQPAEGQHIRNQIDAAMIFARTAFVNVQTLFQLRFNFHYRMIFEI